METTKTRTLAIDHADALAVFDSARLQASDAFIFESSPAIGSEVQTSVIGLGPFEILRDRGSRAEVTVRGRTEPITAPFLVELERRLALFPTQTRFPYEHGGIFGCIGYDTVADMEPRLKKSGYFQTRELETEPRAEVAIVQRLIVFDHAKGKLHLVDTTDAGLEQLEKIVKFATLKSAPKLKISELKTKDLKASLGAESFDEGIEKLKHHIRQGDIFQAVLAERFEYELSVQAIDVFRTLRRISPAPYSYYFNFGERAFLGGSPEALLKVNGGKMLTHPIAGTRPRGRTTAEDKTLARNLNRSTKENAEHLMLVDLARNDLGRMARPGTVNVTAFRSLQRLSNVMHLVSDVEAQLAEGKSALDAFKACFPAGTLSGAPKIRAMEILSGIERTPRGLYGGAVVAFESSLKLDSCIAIRSLEVRGTTAILRAGAGIVADSKAESEYMEIQHKLKPLRQAIATAEALLTGKRLQGAVS